MRVLIADDDVVVRMVLSATVSKLGHEAFEADDGGQAWASYQTHQPDVVVTDRMMPGLDGIELCRRIRNSDAGRYTYVVVVTGHSARHDVLEGFEAGVDDYLVKPVDAFDLEVRLLAAARVTELHQRLAEAAAALELTNRDLASTARTDALTGVGNRRRFDEDLARVHAQSRRRSHPYSVAVADIDHFKAYNDRHGHVAGDRALAAVASALVNSCREADAVYRYGGEEFALIFADAELPPVVEAADRARRAVQSLTLDPTGRPLAESLSISVGVAQLGPEDGNPVDIVRSADAALYAAKRQGRNRVVAEEPPR